MPTCHVVRYRVSYWTKGYNKGKINITLETNTEKTMLIENLSPEHGRFVLDLFSTPGKVTCDPESTEGLVHLNRVVVPPD